MPVIEQIARFADELVDIRRDFHEHPELGMQEFRTSGIVAGLLENWGIETHRNIGQTGVVGVLDGSGPGRTIGLRADMDALPIQEKTNLPFASKTAGLMHACGHDAHTAMLLGAAKYLAANRRFNGRIILIFQPAEEGLGGARAMLADGLFERFPCDEIYAIHNLPSGQANQVSIKPSEAMAGADFFDIEINGSGCHASRPQDGIDAVFVGTSLVQQLQSIVARNTSANDALVLSVTQIHAGAAYNVIPETCSIAGTLRYFSDDIAGMARERIQALCDGMERAYGVTIKFTCRNVFNVLVNNEQLAGDMMAIAAEIVGPENTSLQTSPTTGSEDFADMLQVVPGAYCLLSHEGSVPLHNDGYILDEQILPVGASILARVAEARCNAT